MVTGFGKIIRKLRIDKDISMRVMAEAIRKSTAFISAIEMGKKKINESFLHDIRDYFDLSSVLFDELKSAADKSNGQVVLPLEPLSPQDQDGVLAFARKFSSLSDRQKEKIRSVLINAGTK